MIKLKIIINKNHFNYVELGNSVEEIEEDENEKVPNDAPLTE